MNDEHPQQGEHPDNKTYVFIAGVLTVVTAIEFGVLYTPSLAPILVPLLLSLSTAKFALVAMFYMHLKPDHGLFSLIFLLPLCLAVVVVVFLMALLR